MSNQRNDWGAIFQQYKNSGLTQSAFCKAHALSCNQFQYQWYKHNLAAKAAARKILSSTTPLTHSFETITIASPLPPSKQTDSMVELMIHLPNKIRCDIKIALYGDALPALLKELVGLC